MKQSPKTEGSAEHEPPNMAPTSSILWHRDLDLTMPPHRSPLTEHIEADVVIVGAGYTGLWTAYYLLKANPQRKVVLLEAEYCGFGASGRNGGWCSALFPQSLHKLAGMPGSSREQALALHQAMRATVGEVGK